MKPAKLAATRSGAPPGSRDSGFPAPSIELASLAASAPIAAGSRSGERPTPKPRPGLHLAVAGGHRLQERVAERAAKLPVPAEVATRSAVLVHVDDLLHPAHPRVAVERRPLDPLRQLDHLGGLVPATAGSRSPRLGGLPGRSGGPSLVGVGDPAAPAAASASSASPASVRSVP